MLQKMIVMEKLTNALELLEPHILMLGFGFLFHSSLVRRDYKMILLVVFENI